MGDVHVLVPNTDVLEFVYLLVIERYLWYEPLKISLLKPKSIY